MISAFYFYFTSIHKLFKDENKDLCFLNRKQENWYAFNYRGAKTS